MHGLSAAETALVPASVQVRNVMWPSMQQQQHIPAATAMPAHVGAHVLDVALLIAKHIDTSD